MSKEAMAFLKPKITVEKSYNTRKTTRMTSPKIFTAKAVEIFYNRNPWQKI
jgi:hypothetical protein